jgi:hypothetical protein
LHDLQVLSSYRQGHFRRGQSGVQGIFRKFISSTS